MTQKYTRIGLIAVAGFFGVFAFVHPASAALTTLYNLRITSISSPTFPASIYAKNSYGTLFTINVTATTTLRYKNNVLADFSIFKGNDYVNAYGNLVGKTMSANVVRDMSKTATVQVVSPNGGEVWNEWSGETRPIYISSTIAPTPGSDANSFALALLSSDKLRSWTITQSAQNTFYWKVGDVNCTSSGCKQAPAGTYYVRAKQYNTNLSDLSDKTFKIVIPTSTPSMTVVSPNGGEMWVIGQTYPIQWTVIPLTQTILSACPATADGKYDITKPCTNIYAPYATDKLNSYYWTIPNTITPGSYLLSADTGCCHEGTSGVQYDFSDAPFSIVAATTSQQAPTISYIAPTSTIAEKTVNVYGTNFDSASFIALDGTYGQTITPEPSYTATSLSFNVPSNVSVGAHSVQVGEKASSLPLSNAVTLNVVAATTSTAPTLSVSADPNSLSNLSKTVAAGSQNVGLAGLRFTNTTNAESIDVTDLTVFDQVSAGAKAAFTQLRLTGPSPCSSSPCAAGSATPSSNGYYYQFHFPTPIIVPSISTVSLNLTGDIASYNSSGTTDGSMHTFKIAAPTDVVALGASSNQQAVVTVSGASGGANTILRTVLTATAAPLGGSTRVSRNTTDDIGTITVSASPSGAAALNKLTVTFSGTAPATANFLSGVDLIDQSGVNVMYTYGVTSSTSAACTGTNTCTKTWNFGSGPYGWQIPAGYFYAFKLRVDDTKMPSAAGAYTLNATIANANDVTYTDGLDSAALSNIPLSVNSVPVLVNSIVLQLSGDMADIQAPSVPTGLTASAISSSQINLSWTASTDNVGVTGYKIYRGGLQIATSTTTSYSNTGLSASTTYSYAVSAYDAAGNTSAKSASASATTQGSQAVVTVQLSAGTYGVATGRSRQTADHLGDLIYTVSAGGNGIYLNKITLTFTGSIADGNGFLDRVWLNDIAGYPNGNIAGFPGTQVATSSICSAICFNTKTWTFPSGSLGVPITGYTCCSVSSHLNLYVNSTLGPAGVSGVIQTLKGYVNVVSDITYSDASGNNKTTSFTAPLTINSVSYAVGAYNNSLAPSYAENDSTNVATLRQVADALASLQAIVAQLQLLVASIAH